LVCATTEGPHYLLARRESGDYYVMDPASGTDMRPEAFAVWARLFGGSDSPVPGVALNWLDGKPVRENYYLDLAVWVNTPNASHVLG
jgi:hypothetical protein